MVYNWLYACCYLDAGNVYFSDCYAPRLVYYSTNVPLRPGNDCHIYLFLVFLCYFREKNYYSSSGYSVDDLKSEILFICLPYSFALVRPIMFVPVVYADTRSFSQVAYFFSFNQNSFSLYNTFITLIHARFIDLLHGLYWSQLFFYVESMRIHGLSISYQQCFQAIRMVYALQRQQ